MRKDNISAVIGILLIFVIGALFLVFCKTTAANAPVQMDSDYEDYDDMDDEDEEPSVVATLDQRGYAAYQPLPERIQKLIDSNLFGVTEEKIKLAEEELFEGYETEEDYAEDYFDEDEEYDPEELAELIKEEKKYSKEELEEEYEDTLKFLKKFDAPEFLNRNTNLFVTADSDEDEVEALYCPLKWDNKTGECLDKQKLAVIENCGFSGFSDMVAEVERQQKDSADAFQTMEDYFDGYEDDYYGDGEYRLYCQGVEFSISSSYGEYRYLYVNLNRSSCFIPQQYRNVIDGVKADGGYDLFSSYVAGGKDVLVFRRNQTISTNGYLESLSKKNEFVEKRIVFICDHGTLVDYYVTSDVPRLNLDEVDKKVLDTYASGLGKTLSGAAESASNTGNYLFRAGD